ncbi:MAG: EVE domain-containing protein [Rhizobiaceae bacterium]
MQYWLFKSEPFKWSWENQKAKGDAGEEWDGIRNYQARNNMRAMKIGDRGFFYHSNEGLEIVGIIEVSALSAPDSTTDDERWDCVHIRALCDMPVPVKLSDVKASDALSESALVKSMRLSVQPVRDDEWTEICRMGGLNGETLKPFNQL